MDYKLLYIYLNYLTNMTNLNLDELSREELIALFKQQSNNKKVNKTTKLAEDLDSLFNEYSNNSTDSMLKLYFLLKVLFSNLEVPIIELLDNLDYVPEEEDVRKVIALNTKTLVKTDDFKLRKSKKHNVAVVEEVEEKEINIPL